MEDKNKKKKFDISIRNLIITPPDGKKWIITGNPAFSEAELFLNIEEQLFN